MTSDALGVEPARRTSSKSGVFDGVVLNGCEGIVSYKGQKYPLPAHATVETQGQLQSRVTVTRLLLTGPFAFALRKKRDNRELYLTVEGDGWAFVVDVDPKKGLKAREFAALVNSG